MNARRRKPLTDKVLEAMHAALTSAIAGSLGDGDFEGINYDDLQRGSDWVCAEKPRRRRARAARK